MKPVIATLIVLTLMLQFKLWFGNDSILKVRELKRTLVAQQDELDKLKHRNAQLSAKIENLKNYPAAIEEQARYELGMVKNGEKYFQVVAPIE